MSAYESLKINCRDIKNVAYSLNIVSLIIYYYLSEARYL